MMFVRVLKVGSFADDLMIFVEACDAPQKDDTASILALSLRFSAILYNRV